MSMFNGKYISAYEIIGKVYRDLSLANAINVNDAMEWAGEAIELIGAPFHYIAKTERIKITNYRGHLPCDLHYIETTKGASFCWDENMECYTGTHSAMRYSTDSFHHTYCANNADCTCESSLTYKVNNDCIFTNFEEGEVMISYQAIAVDSNGFPMIPDDIKFKEAVAGHLKWRLAFIEWSKGKMIQAVYNKLEQDRDWYIGAAQTRGQMPSPDMAESIKNNWLRLISHVNQHATGFSDVGEAEQRYTNNSINTNTGRSNDGDTLFYTT